MAPSLAGHPVAGDGESAIPGVMDEAPGQPGGPFAVFGDDPAGAASLHGHACRNQALRGMDMELLLVPHAPAVAIDHFRILGRNACQAPTAGSLSGPPGVGAAMEGAKRVDNDRHDSPSLCRA